MKTHELKILAMYAKPKIDGIKPFEIRRNDRDYKVGDLVKYTVTDDEELNKIMEDKTYRILYITDYAQKEGYIVWGEVDDGKEPKPKKIKRFLFVEDGSVDFEELEKRILMTNPETYLIRYRQGAIRPELVEMEK